MGKAAQGWVPELSQPGTINGAYRSGETRELFLILASIH